MIPFSGQLELEISGWVEDSRPIQSGYAAGHGKYSQITKMRKPSLSYLPEGILSGAAHEYIGPNGTGLMGIFWYSISGQIWRKSMNFVVDAEGENWRNKDWVRIN